MEIRWDTGLMADLSASLESKARALAARRIDAFEVFDRVGVEGPGLRRIAIAADWATFQAGKLVDRRARLVDAESGLLWRLTTRPGLDGTLPQLRSRSHQSIVADLDGAIETLAWHHNGPDTIAAARVELRVAELTHELAVAERDRHLLAETVPDIALMAEFESVIDYLGYEIARARPAIAPDWTRVEEATAGIRQLLDESWFRDVGRADLFAIQEAVSKLDRPELDAVIQRLSDDELYRWLHELDGVRGGNFNEAEETHLFTAIARRASAATLYRLATAELGSRFMEMAAAVRDDSPLEVQLEFIEICSAAAIDSDAALIAALAGISSLTLRHRLIIVTSLEQQGLLDPLSDATHRLLRLQSVERSQPVVVEFFAGMADAVAGAVTTLADLTIAGLVDRHHFREAWSRVGGLVQLAFDDPIAFAEVVLDVETLRRNPARWAGAVVPDLASAVIGRVARAGRLGRVTQRIAQWLKRVGEVVVLDAQRLKLRVEHINEAVQRIGAATDAAAVRDALAQLGQVESYVAELDEMITGLPTVGPSAATQYVSALAAKGASLVDQLLESVGRASSALVET